VINFRFHAPSTWDIVTPKQARKFLEEHVLISKKDLAKIAALCKKRGIYEELKKLNVMTYELAPGRGGAWAGEELPPPKQKPVRRSAKKKVAKRTRR